MPRETIVLHSPLAIAEFEARLHSVVDEETWWNQMFPSFIGDQPLTCRFRGNKFRLNRKQRLVRNGFARLFYGHYEPEPGGVRIEGHFDVLPYTKWFMRCWLGFAVVIAGLSYFAVLKHLFRGTLRFSDLSPLELIPLGFVLYGFFFPRLSQWMSRGSEEFILEYLEYNLAASAEPTVV